RDHWRNMVDTVLTQEVKNHTISKAQASAVTSAITQWIQMYRGGGSGHHGPRPQGHGQGMMGRSGNRRYKRLKQFTGPWCRAGWVRAGRSGQGAVGSSA